jgi:hypothetical protein
MVVAIGSCCDGPLPSVVASLSDWSRLMATVSRPWLPCILAMDAVMLTVTARSSASYSSVVLALDGGEAMKTGEGRAGGKKWWL